ncbi:unnamed protein product [Ranitomeya imitator]|uniref:LysM and peptidoglycan-binding domain-containing protein 2 n=1 Tax=Ranitomeya imitator TaxID=111125 RepID=A0ABN9M7Q4_9NEOB|nr:unnamed protein product [Ranitomeya imitator]
MAERPWYCSHKVKLKTPNPTCQIKTLEILLQKLRKKTVHISIGENQGGCFCPASPKTRLKHIRYFTTLFVVAEAPFKNMEQVKRANKLFSTDCIFLRKSLNIPVISEKPSLFNGLNLLDSPENDCPEDSSALGEEEVSSPANPTSPPTSPVSGRPVVTQDEELSAKDFLQRLDLQIKRSTQAAKRLKEEEYLRDHITFEVTLRGLYDRKYPKIHFFG